MQALDRSTRRTATNVNVLSARSEAKALAQVPISGRPRKATAA